eukprot:1768882-Rhodomonas_salina.1
MAVSVEGVGPQAVCLRHGCLLHRDAGQLRASISHFSCKCCLFALDAASIHAVPGGDAGCFLFFVSLRGGLEQETAMLDDMGGLDLELVTSYANHVKEAKKREGWTRLGLQPRCKPLTVGFSEPGRALRG